MRTLAFLLLVTSGTAQAQMWCPPEARWHYENFAFGQGGHFNYTYNGDTVVLGLSAQRIVRSAFIINYPGSQFADTFQFQSQLHTALQGELLLYLKGTSPDMVWDTLHRFDAVPGDRWTLPMHEFYCIPGSPSGTLEVADTGLVVIGGMSLRYWEFWVLNGAGQQANTFGRFYERLGFVYGMNPYPNCDVVIELGEYLRCYSDEAIFYNNSSSWSEPCDVALGLNERSRTIRAFPNPGSDHLTLQLPGGMHSIEVFDVTGRRVLSEPAVNANLRIDTETLPSGTYCVLVSDARGTVWRSPWMKE